jgi:hypothetical protein
MRPQYQYVPVPEMRSAFCSIRLRTQEAVEHFPVAQTRPARPATCGVAMEVPFSAS